MSKMSISNSVIAVDDACALLCNIVAEYNADTDCGASCSFADWFEDHPNEFEMFCRLSKSMAEMFDVLSVTHALARFDLAMLDDDEFETMMESARALHSALTMYHGAEVPRPSFCGHQI